ncbi:MAG: hypothetical protein LUC34_02260 [Campylobacter sp.]|nr:hypothetical protein [Campylobacter sp.]
MIENKPQQLTLFDISNQENDKFELSSHKNGGTYWLASELAAMLEGCQ